MSSFLKQLSTILTNEQAATISRVDERFATDLNESVIADVRETILAHGK